MSLQTYSIVTTYWNGSLLSEETTVSIDRDTRAQEIVTVSKGFSGLSPGAPIMQVSIDSAVPAADFELNPGPYMKALAVGEFTAFAAGRTLTAKGFIIKDNTSHSANAESKISYSFILEFADWT